MDLVSVVIPTYNRFKYVLNTIKSVKEQTYPNIEIIVVNDASTEKEYYEYDWPGVKIIHLEKNSKQIFGHACGGYVRNQGILASSGKYVAFCDDDDTWFPQKIELQLAAMEKSGCSMSCTDGLIGSGPWSPSNTYKKYNAEYYYRELQNIYKQSGSSLMENGFPDIFTLEFIRVHNCIITSSVIISKDILSKINNMNNYKNGQEDYDCWLRALEHTSCVYLQDICFYYDLGHGYGQNY
jgi:glycosyltransferase involved in cell wall biosynthesis